MTPEREAQLRIWAEPSGGPCGAPDDWEAMLGDALLALDTERERNAKLERVMKAAFVVNEWCEDYSGDAGIGLSIVDRDAMIELDDALSDLEEK
jgi:hypothetical protein